MAGERKPEEGLKRVRKKAKSLRGRSVSYPQCPYQQTPVCGGGSNRKKGLAGSKKGKLTDLLLTGGQTAIYRCENLKSIEGLGA